MAKFYGSIGYAMTVESRPGFWEDCIEERKHFGDVVRNTARWTASPESTIDDVNLNNQISIVYDPFARDHFHQMKYIRFMGAEWKITNVEIQHPRLILTIGGLYNGPLASEFGAR